MCHTAGIYGMNSAVAMARRCCRWVWGGWQAGRQNMVDGLHNYRQRYKQTHTHTYIQYTYIHESPRTISALRYMQIDAIETFAIQLVSHILVLNYDWKLAFNWKYTASGIVMNSSIASGALCEWKCLLLSPLPVSLLVPLPVRLCQRDDKA